MARPKSDDAAETVGARLYRRHREYLELWRPGGQAGDQVRDVIEFAMKFRPKGPDAFGHDRNPDAPIRERKTSAIKREATRRGIPEAALLNEMWRVYKEQGVKSL